MISRFLGFKKKYKEIKNISLQSRKIVDVMSIWCYLGGLNKDFPADNRLWGSINYSFSNNKDSILLESVGLDWNINNS